MGMVTYKTYLPIACFPESPELIARVEKLDDDEGKRLWEEADEMITKCPNKLPPIEIILDNGRSFWKIMILRGL